MVKVLIEESPNTFRSPDDEMSTDESQTVDDVIRGILDYNPDLLHDKKILIVNHPLYNMKLLNEDNDVIEPGILEEIHDKILEKISNENYSFILFNNLESYILRDSDSNVMSNYLTKLSVLLETLDDYHIEIFVTLSEDFYKNNYTIFDIYLD